MFHFRKKIKFPTTIFVVASLSIFVLFFLLVFILLINYQYSIAKPITKRNSLSGAGDKYFLNKNYNPKDPYMTKIPSLRDMLAGPIITDLDPSQGNINADSNLVIFSDFECDYCAQEEKVLKEIMQDYDVRLVWKDYPAVSTDTRSYQASIAARCAQVENAFWEYHDRLFEDNNDLSREKLLAIARDLHLDIDDFGQCLDNQETAQLVNDNIKEANALGIDGVPFLYVNDQEIFGEINKKDLEKIIKTEMNK